MTLAERAKLARAHRLAQLVAENTPTRVIALRLRISESAVYRLASEFGISLKPTNQAPRTRQPLQARRSLRRSTLPHIRRLRRAIREAMDR
jgi:hypothetical protein